VSTLNLNKIIKYKFISAFVFVAVLRVNEIMNCFELVVHLIHQTKVLYKIILVVGSLVLINVSYFLLTEGKIT